MERKHVRDSKGKPLYGGYINDYTRVYYDSEEGGQLVAVACSQDGFDNFVNYFCLPGIWEQDAQTSWKSAEELQWLIED